MSADERPLTAKEPPLIQVKDLRKYYRQKVSGRLRDNQEKFVKAVKDASFSIDKGEILGLIGESGCGKSTLANVLGRLEKAGQGEIYLDGVDTRRYKDRKEYRRRVQMVFQNPYDSFPPGKTVLQILTRPLILHKIGGNRKERIRICREALESGGLIPAEDFMERYPEELSGGQLQRISIIRALLLKPDLLIADEPVSMLDVSVQADIINLLVKLQRKHQMTVLFISHDIALTLHIADKIAVMHEGEIIEYGTSDSVASCPQQPYTKMLLETSLELP